MLFNSIHYIERILLLHTLFCRYYDEAKQEEVALLRLPELISGKTIYSVPEAIMAAPNTYQVGCGLITYKNGERCIIKKGEEDRFLKLTNGKDYTGPNDTNSVILCPIDYSSA